MITSEQRSAAIDIIRLMCLLIQEATSNGMFGGLPSGQLYSDLNAKGMSLDSYNAIIGALVREGAITNKGHLLVWTGKIAMKEGL